MGLCVIILRILFWLFVKIKLIFNQIAPCQKNECVFLCVRVWVHLLKFLENIFLSFFFGIVLKINARLSLWNFLDLGGIQKLGLLKSRSERKVVTKRMKRSSMNIHAARRC